MNLLFAVVLFASLFMVSGGDATRSVSTVLPGHPAARAGLKPGDYVVAVDGIFVTAPEIPRVINASKGHKVTVIVYRNGKYVSLRKVKAVPEDGSYRLGFILAGRSLTAPQAVWRSFRLTADVTTQIGKSMSRLVTGSGRKQLSSPVGIVRGSSTALQEGVVRYLWVLGLISLSLALLNLLPLLPLDGGHIAFSIVEAIRGRSVGREIYERVSAVGIAVVLLLFFVGLSNDLGGGR